VNKTHQNMGEKKIPALLLELSVPATVGMLVNALYNLVDTIFVGKGVSSDAIGGLTVAMPLQMIIMAFGFLIGIGAGSLISRSLGAGDNERAYRTAGNAYAFVTIISVIAVFIGFLFMDQFLILFGATETLLPYAKEYLSVILMGSVFFIITLCSNNIIRAEGNAKMAMLIMITGAVINIGLDALFIFVFRMGVAGAAWATIISQFCSFLVVVWYMAAGRSSLKIRLRHFKPDLSVLKEIFGVGTAGFIRQTSASVVAIVVNNALKIYGGTEAINVIGIFNRLSMFMIMPVFGIVQGMQPIMGFNYGAKKPKRVMEVLKLSMISATIITTTAWAMSQFIPEFLLSLFIRPEEKEVILSIGVPALRTLMAVMPIVGIQIVGSAMFQALGKAIPSIVLASLRQIILLIPMVLILSKIAGVTGVWISYPVSDFISVVMTAVFVLYELKKLKNIFENLKSQTQS
jgi:putative MATE family efflux protein